MHTRLSLLFVTIVASSTLFASDLTVTDLRCDYVRAPLGVDSAVPRLFWRVESSVRSQRQTAYRVLVASTRETLAQDRGDLWDSGKVLSDETLHISYGGRPLATSQQVFWKVRAWDKNGKPSAWSAPETWTMGILTDADWRASWIGSPSNQPVRQWLGYHANTSKVEDAVKWVQVDLGQSRPISAVRLLPLDHAGKKGFGFPLRFKVEISNDPQFKAATLIADQTAADFPNPGAEPVAFDAKAASARFIRVTANKLWKHDTVYCFALCQLEALSQDRNVAQGASVTALDTIENYGWSLAGLTDGGCGEPLPAPNSGTLLFRREFLVKPTLKRALVSVCGLGCYELSLNGRKAGWCWPTACTMWSAAVTRNSPARLAR
jgi:alpha-L-rhamnosidase